MRKHVVPFEPSDPPGVTIITVALNAARDLPLTIESVIQQDYPDVEYIVVDGMSWDESGSILKRYEDDIEKIIVRDDAGIYSAMNDALDYVSKEYVLFLNAGDHFYCEDSISKMVAGIVGSPDIFYGNHIYVDRARETFKRSARFDLIAGRLAKGVVDHRWHNLIPGHQATFVRADLLRQLRFDTRLQICADHELLFRAYEQGAEMLYIDETVAHYAGGGYSAMRGDRCRIEWASVYRRFSDRPEAIDHLFYPNGAPFDLQTERTGIRLSGFYPAEHAAIEWNLGGRIAWCAGGGCQLLTPSLESSKAEVVGYNPFMHQQVDLYLGDEAIGSAAIPFGLFQVDIAFSRPIPAKSVVELIPLRFGALPQAGGRTVGLALKECRFGRDGHDSLPSYSAGTVLRFRLSNIVDFRDAIGVGWSDPEPEHLWSVGLQSELRLKPARNVQRMSLTLGANPHVLAGQSLEISVNAVPVMEVALPQLGDVKIDLDCTSDVWRRGRANRISLRISGAASPPGDDRSLGIRLWQIEFL